MIKVDAHTTSLAILNEDQLQLFRTLENSRGVTISGEQLAEEVYPSVVFFQDTYHLNIERIYVAGLPESGGAAPALKAARPEPRCGAGFIRAVGKQRPATGAAVENGRSGRSVALA